ncbi:hypothetical protein ACVDG8_008000 [Mesorhizobium sp. ORM8.1]
MQRHQRCAVLGQIGVEVDAVQVNDVDGPECPRLGYRPALRVLGAALGRFVERALLGRYLDQCAGGARPLATDNDRAVSFSNQSVVEHRKHLLGAANRIGPDRRQRVSDVEDGQGHG